MTRALKSLLIGLLLAIMLGVSYWVFKSNKQATEKQAAFNAVSETSEGVSESVTEPAKGKEVSGATDDVRRLAMQSRFDDLQLQRRSLESKARLLKSKIWNLSLPPEQAKSVSYKMRQAFAYLKNPSMLGAFHEVEDIEREMRKIDAIMTGLSEAEALIGQAKSKTQ